MTEATHKPPKRPVIPSGVLGGNELARWHEGPLAATLTRFDGETRLGQHSHACTTVTIVMQGSFSETDFRSTGTYGLGSTLIKPSGAVHANRFAGQATCLTLELDLERANLPSRFKPMFRTHGFDHSLIVCSLARLIERELLNSDDFSSLALSTTVVDILAELCQRVTQKDAARSPWVKSVIAMVHEEPHISLQAIASELGLHPVYVARGFRKSLGCTIGSYARTLALERAIDLLIDGKMTLAEIAPSVGFADQSHLTRLLRRRVGLTPAVLRSYFSSSRDGRC